MTPTLTVEHVPLATLARDATNARRHPKKNRDAIRESLSRYGQVEPLVVQRSNNRVLGGNGRLEEMRALGWAEASVTYVDLDDAKADALAITLNRTGELATWDMPQLGATLRQLGALDFDLPSLGWDAAELAPLTAAPQEQEGDDDEWHAGPEQALVAPFPWFGGKRRVSREVWARFGDVPNYVEPFFGSGAVLLGRPEPLGGTETVNDLDGFVANCWRAVAAAPDETAKHADNPVNENDLHARHSWLVAQRAELRARLEGDPEFFDPKIAGWWAWEISCWIGSGFASGEGPWTVQDGKLLRTGATGHGVARQLVHLSGEQGVNRTRVHLSDAGQGVNRNIDNGIVDGSRLIPWFRALAARLAQVRVCSGDWSRVCGPSVTHKHGLTGVFLDPPYADTSGRAADLYAADSQTVAHAVREWAIAEGENPLMRIALCGYDGEHEMPSSWSVLRWKAAGGYAGQGDGANDNARRERIWFSPACIR